MCECRNQNNNKNNTIWWGSVLTGEEPPLHSGELNHALSQAGGPTQSQLSRLVSSGHHISVEHRLRRKRLLLNPNTRLEAAYTEKIRKKKHIFQEKQKNEKLGKWKKRNAKHEKMRRNGKEASKESTPRDGSKQLRPKKIRFFSTQEKKNNDEQTWKRSHLKWGTPGPFTCPLSTEAQKSNFHKRTVVFFYGRNFWMFFFQTMLQFWVLVAILALGKLDITSTSFMRVRSVMMVWIFWGTCVRHRCGVVLVPRESVSWVFRHIAQLDRDTLSTLGSHLVNRHQQQYNLERLRFHRRGASIPLWVPQAGQPTSPWSTDYGGKQLNSDTNASNKTYLKEIREERKEEFFSQEK